MAIASEDFKKEPSYSLDFHWKSEICIEMW